MTYSSRPSRGPIDISSETYLNLSHKDPKQWPKNLQERRLRIIRDPGTSPERHRKITQEAGKRLNNLSERERKLLNQKKERAKRIDKDRSSLESLANKILESRNTDFLLPPNETLNKFAASPDWLEVKNRLGDLTAIPENRIDREGYSQQIQNLESILFGYFVHASKGKIDNVEGAKSLCLVFLDLLNKRGGAEGKIDRQDLDILDRKNGFLDKVLGTGNFVAALEQTGVDVEKGKDDWAVAMKKDFLLKHFSALARNEVVGGVAQKSSRLRFFTQAKVALNTMVGGKHLKKADWNEAWNQVMNDENVKLILDENSGADTQDDFADRADMEEADIRSDFAEEKRKIDMALRDAKSNPYGFLGRKYGDLFGGGLYLGKEILYGVVLVNLALAGFNPLELIKNPVALVTIGATLGIGKYYNPDFMKPKAEAVEIAEARAQESLEKITDPKLREHLALIGEGDLAPYEPLGMLLEKKGVDKITTADLKKVFAKNKDMVFPKAEIAKDSDEAKKLYIYLKTCKQQGISPKEIIDA